MELKSRPCLCDKITSFLYHFGFEIWLKWYICIINMYFNGFWGKGVVIRRLWGYFGIKILFLLGFIIKIGGMGFWRLILIGKIGFLTEIVLIGVICFSYIMIYVRIILLFIIFISKLSLFLISWIYRNRRRWRICHRWVIACHWRK